MQSEFVLPSWREEYPIWKLGNKNWQNALVNDNQVHLRLEQPPWSSSPTAVLHFPSVKTNTVLIPSQILLYWLKNHLVNEWLTCLLSVDAFQIKSTCWQQQPDPTDLISGGLRAFLCYFWAVRAALFHNDLQLQWVCYTVTTVNSGFFTSVLENIIKYI